ncbi:hypothetical protein [Parasitella parasitica]|uniref:F-box domain-containing protein n=1 Tax=Parasitella parasitica TaxID=35722 RepID=A0A0B7NG08_9FUNG|nr:hypothetical protein [Parasitella parasitica]
MYKLSSLPIEILYKILDNLDTNDIITMARLNSWFSYRLSTLLGERIEHNVKSDGWRIHIDILAKSYPFSQASSSFPFPTELLLLSEFSRINPYTLTLEFNLYPIDDDGLDAIVSATQSQRSIVLFDKIKTNVDIVAYFAQISTNRRLQHVNQAGAAIMNDRNILSSGKEEESSGLAVMGTGFKIQYNLTRKIQDKDMLKLVDQFKLDYEQHKSELDVLCLQDESPAVLSFHKVHVSPEWWLKQMKIPSFSSNEQQEPQHGYW